MRRLNISFAMLALLLAFGLVFVGCDNGTTEEPEVPVEPEVPRTIQSLWDLIKPFASGNYLLGNLRVYDSDRRQITYCTTHQTWEDYESGGPPAFTLAKATELRAWIFITEETKNNPYFEVFTDTLPKLIPVLDSFYTDKYKLNTPPRNTTTYADGTPMRGWYVVRLYSNGEGHYGSSTTATQASCMVNYYYFGD